MLAKKQNVFEEPEINLEDMSKKENVRRRAEELKSKVGSNSNTQIEYVSSEGKNKAIEEINKNIAPGVKFEDKKGNTITLEATELDILSNGGESDKDIKHDIAFTIKIKNKDGVEKVLGEFRVDGKGNLFNETKESTSGVNIPEDSIDITKTYKYIRIILDKGIDYTLQKQGEAKDKKEKERIEKAKEAEEQNKKQNQGTFDGLDALLKDA